MFLAGSKKPSPTRPGPFGQSAPEGPGVASAQGTDLFTDALMRRRRWAAHALGDTPPRDGPFAPAAAVAAIQFPPKTRQEVRKKTTGLNPFA